MGQYIKNLPGINKLLLMVFPSLSIIFLISSSHCLSPFWPQGVQSKQDPEMNVFNEDLDPQRVMEEDAGHDYLETAEQVDKSVASLPDAERVAEEGGEMWQMEAEKWGGWE